MDIKIQELMNLGEYDSVIQLLIHNFQSESFTSLWQLNISDIIKEQEIRINSLVIGKVGETSDRIYVGANSNKVLVLDITGKPLSVIELDEGIEIKKIIISDVRDNQANKELIILTSDDIILFYDIHKNSYRELQSRIMETKADINSFFSISLGDENKPIFIGNSNGDLIKTSYSNLEIDIDGQQLIPSAVKIAGESISAITGSHKLLNDNFGLIVGYKNGLILVFDEANNLRTKYDIQEEIENMYLVENSSSIIVTSDNYKIYHLSLINYELHEDWNYDYVYPISSVLPDLRDNSEVEFYILSEDTGTISGFDKDGQIIFTGDPSFEGTAGAFFDGKLFLSSREGDISQFELISLATYREWQNLIFDSYKALCEFYDKNDFYEFFNSEFESEERVAYFQAFLVDYLSNHPSDSILTKINDLFLFKRYNSDMAEGLINSIVANSKLREVFLTVFPNSPIAEEIRGFERRIFEKINETNLYSNAKAILKSDPIKYIELMSELKIRKVDKIWVKNIFEDDDVVGIEYYPDPIDNTNQILVATKKGRLFLLNRYTGKTIWSFTLSPEDGEITNIAVADIFLDHLAEILVGCKNQQNSILILSTDKDKFHSDDNVIQMTLDREYPPEYKLYFIRTRIPGIDGVNKRIHKVHCFDFDNNGMRDLIISSENGKFDVFYFDSPKRNRIVLRTDRINYDDNDILVFEIVREKGNKIILYTGSDYGTLDKHIYNGDKFVRSNQSFFERDARITDIKYIQSENENFVLFSSEDNFIYCLTKDLDYKWSFQTKGDARAVGSTKFNGEELIFAISKDNYLYAFDYDGNKKWDYSFHHPLDKFLVNNNEIVVADGTGNIHMLNLMNSDKISEEMKQDLSEIQFNFDTASFIENRTDNPVNVDKYVKLYAIQKILSENPNPVQLHSIMPSLSEKFESEEVLRLETINMLTSYFQKFESIIPEYSSALIATLGDSSADVRVESVKSFFTLLNQHKMNGIDIRGSLVAMTKDPDNWVKEYFAGMVREIETDDEYLLHAKWGALSSLLKYNKKEEWILNESAISIGTFLQNVQNDDLLLEYLNELFQNDFEQETFERIEDKIQSPEVKYLYDIYMQALFGDIKKLNKAVAVFSKNIKIETRKENIRLLIKKAQLCIKITEQRNLDDVIDDKIIVNFFNLFGDPVLPFEAVISNLADYEKEMSTSDKVVYLNSALDSINSIENKKISIPNIERRLIKLAIEDHLADIISKTSKLLRNSINLDIEIENREVILNENGFADINFNIINKGFKKVEEIDISIKPNPQFDFTEDIGEIGELVKSQNKKVFFKIKPKLTGQLSIALDINYKGSEINDTKEIKVLIRDAVHKEWIVIPNPYSVGTPIENDDIFVGRESLIQEALTAIKKDPVFVMGHRRMGKTSLIKYIQRNYLNTEEYLPVFVSAERMVFDTMNSFLYLFIRPIAKEAVEAKIITDEEAKSYLSQIMGNGLLFFGIFFDDLLGKIKKLNKTLILIIDEYPIIHEAVDKHQIDPQFVSNLRGLMQNNSKEFKMIYSGASSLKYLKSQYSSNIMGVGKSIEVSFLSEVEVKKLITRPLNNKMQLEDSAFQYFMELTNGQPFLVQVILNYLVEKLNREQKSSIVFKDAIEDGVKYFLDQAPHLKTDWGSFDEGQENRFVSSNLSWDTNEEKIAKGYKQLIITAVTDNWKKTKNGLLKQELYAQLNEQMSEFHKINLSIFDETLSLMAGTSDILKIENHLYFIKVGLFREWVINRMNFTFSKSMIEIKTIFSTL